MKKVKVINVKTSAVKEVPESLTNDYLGTGEFILYKEKPAKVETKEETFVVPNKKHNKKRR